MALPLITFSVFHRPAMSLCLLYSNTQIPTFVPTLIPVPAADAPLIACTGASAADVERGGEALA